LHEFVEKAASELIDNFKVDQVRMTLMGFDSNPVEDIIYQKDIIPTRE